MTDVYIYIAQLCMWDFVDPALRFDAFAYTTFLATCTSLSLSGSLSQALPLSGSRSLARSLALSIAKASLMARSISRPEAGVSIDFVYVCAFCVQETGDKGMELKSTRFIRVVRMLPDPPSRSGPPVSQVCHVSSV